MEKTFDSGSGMPDETPRIERTIRLTVAYDGSNFVGWQRQATGVSIQGLLEDALSRIDGAHVTVIGAGRTDAWVHACGQVASARLTASLDCPTMQRAINAMLPPDVRVLDVVDVPLGFHARYAALSKTYRYSIAAGAPVTPFDWRYCWHMAAPLDIAAMSAAAAAFEGEHDFAAFQSTGSSVHTSRRRVLGSHIFTVPSPLSAPWGSLPASLDAGPRIVYEVTATGFLRHMVRAMVGTLVEIGLGRRSAESVAATLLSENRGDAGATAPACGLCLLRVEYGSGADVLEPSSATDGDW